MECVSAATDEFEPTEIPRPHAAEWSYLMDMDGVLVHEEHMIPGADQFIAELNERGTNYVVVTNNPIYTRRDLRARLLATGLDIAEDRIGTSALATARFLHSQRPDGRAYGIRTTSCSARREPTRSRRSPRRSG